MVAGDVTVHESVMQRDEIETVLTAAGYTVETYESSIQSVDISTALSGNGISASADKMVAVSTGSNHVIFVVLKATSDLFLEIEKGSNSVKFVTIEA